MQPVECPGREPREGIPEKDGGIGAIEIEWPADLLEKHRLTGGADREMNLPPGSEEHFEEPDGVGRP
jgi:hypothetical protein